MKFQKGKIMSPQQILLAIIIIVLTLLSGLADAQGFTHAAITWINGNIIWSEALKSLLGFAVGAICYILVINFLNQAGFVSAEIQTMIWFSVAIVGVAIISGKFLHWQRIDQIVSILILCGMTWLLIRVGG